MDAMNEALKRKKAKITITVDDPNDVELVGRDGAPVGGAAEGLMEEGLDDLEADVEDAEMEALAEEESPDYDDDSDERGPPSAEKDQKNNPDLAPGVYDKDEESGPDMAEQIFDKKEFTRRLEDGQGKPRGLTDRAGLAAFRKRK